jgi:heme exporter protein D
LQFDSLNEFVAMGGHGLYVWLAYGATLLVLGGYVLSLRRARTQRVRELKWQSENHGKVSHES